MKYSEFVKQLTECPFCHTSTLSNEKIFENDTAYLTFSIAPYHPDHLMVIPKRHVTNMLEITEQEVHDIDDLEKRALKTMRKLGYKDITMLVREGRGSGQSIDHIHYHIVPEVMLTNLSVAGTQRDVMSTVEIARVVNRIRTVDAEK